MRALVIDGATRAMGPPPGVSSDDCFTLHIRDIETKLGNQMWSAWEPTDQEIEQLKSGSKLYLVIHGQSHPMVALAVGDYVDSEDCGL